MLRRAGALVLLGAAMLAVALLVPGASFFHQNGHGHNWIGYALGQPCPYGPGFAELFGVAGAPASGAARGARLRGQRRARGDVSPVGVDRRAP